MLDKNTPAVLILENGRRFEGKALGYGGTASGEVVFTTGMCGYQETLTDSSFAGQIVVMTYPLIGNYGINLEDMESDKPSLTGFIIKEKCDMPSNWRNEMSFEGFLQQHKVIGLEGIDTRSLTKELRDNGTLRGLITLDTGMSTEEAVSKLSTTVTQDLIADVTTKQKYKLGESQPKKHIAVLDLGIKRSILRGLIESGCSATVYPAFSSAEEILAEEPDAILISNGPGNPEDISQVINEVKALIKVKPVIGVSLGCMVLGLALGCETEHMKFGHHGSNYPVRDIDTNRVYITAQNHNHTFAKLSENVEAWLINVNDDTIEGIRHKELPLRGIQFYPEISPGPNDTNFYISDFIKSI